MPKEIVMDVGQSQIAHGVKGFELVAVIEFHLSGNKLFKMN